MSLLTGHPKVLLTVEDQSIIKNTPISGIILLQGITKRGETNVPHFCGSPLQFRRKLGGERTDDKFPSYCLRLLNAGAKLWVIRAAHYSDVSDPGTIDGTKATGSIQPASDGSAWTATAVGDGYNTTSVTIVAAKSGAANKFDVTIQHGDSDIDYELLDVDKAPDAAGIASINLKLNAKGAQVNLVSIAGAGLVAGTVTLSSGAQTIGSIVAADYTGNVAGTGWHVGNAVTDAFRAANIGIEDPDVDEGLRVYIEARKDMVYHIPTPIGVNATGMGAYRDGTSPYSHTAHDSFYGRLVAGDINITDQITGEKYDIPGLVDVLALQARKDIKYGNWFSAAGPKRGKINMPNNGISYNLGSAALSASFDTIYSKGVNAVIQDPDYGVVYWGNKSLKQDVTSLLNKENVSDLVVYMVRRFKPLVRATMFDPNDPVMWREIYRRVRPFIQELESNRAIRPGENKFWFWQGDQDADTIDDAVFNNSADLDAGKYKARFVFVPKVATEFIGIELVPTDSESVDYVIQENPVI